MTKCIAFLHRIRLHKDLFVKVGKIYREKYDIEPESCT